MADAVQCEECEDRLAVLRCTKCDVAYCEQCSEEAHEAFRDSMGDHTDAITRIGKKNRNGTKKSGRAKVCEDCEESQVCTSGLCEESRTLFDDFF